MKQFLLFLTLLVAAGVVNAQSSAVLLNESFESYSNGNLHSQGSWGAAGSSNRVQVANATPLSYTGYPSGSKYVNVVQRDDYYSSSWPFTYNTPDDPYKSFTTSVNSSTNTTFYMSFLVRVASNSATESTNNARPTIALRNSVGSNVAGIYIADNGANLKFGIKKDATGDGVYGTSNYTFGNTYLIVVRYDVRTGSGTNDRMYLWVNPSLGSEPSTSSASATIDASGDDGVVSSSTAGLQLFQEENSATASLDAFKVSYARGFGNNPAAAWEALNPGAAPLPVTFGEIKGYSKDAGVQVDWTVHTELNVSHYDVERSSDGIHFDKIGSVAAMARDGVLYYTWNDPSPLSAANFYRVKNVDLDGAYSYSAVVKVNSVEKQAMNNVTVYPNPVQNNRINLQTGNLARGTYAVEIYNAGGQRVYSKAITHSGGAASHAIQLPAGTQAGIYHIRLAGENVKVVKQFLVP